MGRSLRERRGKALGKRRKGRELALAVLYQWDLLRKPWEKVFEETARDFSFPSEAKKFARELVEGVVLNTPLLDSLIERFIKNWSLDRLSVVDRNILRLAIYEMLHHEETPPLVALDEAVELSKKFSEGEKSGSFVNAILDKIYRENFHGKGE